MDIVTHALCLCATEQGENGKRVILATFDRGLMSAVLLSANKSKNRLGASPLTFGEYAITQKKPDGLGVITGVTVEDTFQNCWTNPEKARAGFSVLRFLEKIGRIACDPADLSSLLAEALKALSAINYNDTYAPAHATRFFARALGFLGIDLAETSLPVWVTLWANVLCDAPEAYIDALEVEPAIIDKCQSYILTVLKETLSITL